MDAHLGGHTAPSQLCGDSDLLPSRCQTWLSCDRSAPQGGKRHASDLVETAIEDDTLPGRRNSVRANSAPTCWFY